MSSRSDTVHGVRLRLDIVGVVQGVGFRPAVARIAARHGLSGCVYNDSGSVHCELEGPPEQVDAAMRAIMVDHPPMARIDSIRTTALPPIGESGFRILDSRSGDERRTLVPPDIAVCDDCLRELRDPRDRRYGHPFITCTNCGPRYTVITDLPYDRPTTTMAQFPMCTRCATEYCDPTDRRFHAQTIACPDCGPTLSWHGPGGGDPLDAAAAAIDSGLIVAVKGIGGFHLACRANDVAAVATLRRRKNRPAKPFAVMVADIAGARRVCDVDEAAANLLRSAAAPIVLLPARDDVVAAGVAPGLSEIGVVLAYSPVHHLLFDRLGSMPLVMTSANDSGSPIVFRDADLGWIDGLADAVLTHDRPVHVPCEDSVLTVEPNGAVVPIRRSRGYAPLPVRAPGVTPRATILATGGDLKTTFCLMSSDGHAHMSSHLGDMADPRTQRCFESALDHLSFMTDSRSELIACDLHPSYATTSWAQRQNLPIVRVQHHHAHAVSLLAEHGRLGTAMLAVAFDGTGYGTDGTVWGGELLIITDPGSFTRVGHLAPFALPGGEGAVRRPERIALELLHRAQIDWTPDIPAVRAMSERSRHVLAQQIPRGIGCIPTSSMGRMFDAVASLLGVCQEVTYEGQAAVELEHLARRGHPEPMEFAVTAGVLDPLPLVAALVQGLRAGVPRADLAAGFHVAVIEATTRAIGHAAAGIRTVGLTGGVFVNRLLRVGLRERLVSDGYEVLTHAVLPCNDGGLALGQAVIAAQRQERGTSRCVSEFPAR
ncbi:carbamoyltransferase HypF [Mycobacterium vicinigordonae]|uniref:Carbamoyltransferase n=1 Tax=Mycobacterium vicinigordonae TaxID=1719132 RepID=A0A7D6HVZ6_9MYCO|nr:carbamoyltransferase HypF [Mycobacterium vicinigordonae]QLL05715.1 carbamoyltransferase HypF [Mycobacterium vicinigordonae]